MYVYIEVLLSTQVSLFMYISFFSFQGKAPPIFSTQKMRGIARWGKWKHMGEMFS